MLWRKKDRPGKRLVILDGLTWQERLAVAEDETQISDGERAFPKSALSRYWDEAGEEVWIANAPREVLIEAETLEDVRRSSVLKNVFAYQKPLPNVNYVIYVGLLVVILVMAWRL